MRVGHTRLKQHVENDDNNTEHYQFTETTGSCSIPMADKVRFSLKFSLKRDASLNSKKVRH